MGKKLVATSMVALGVGTFAYFDRGPIEDALERNGVPGLVQTNPDYLPFALPGQTGQQATESLICPENTITSCKVSTALGSVSLAGHSIIPFNGISKNFRDSIIAIEDNSFYSNKGCDAKSIARAAVHTAEGHKEGGSGITRQDVSNIEPVKTDDELKPYLKVTTPDVATQLVECSEAIAVEKKELQIAQQQHDKNPKLVPYPKVAAKNTILADYANRINYGRAFGVEDASESFFGVHASQLKLSQAMVLAVVVNDPNKLGLLYGNQDITSQSRNLYTKYISSHGITVDANSTASKNTLKHAVNISEQSHEITLAAGQQIENYPFYVARKGLLIARVEEDAHDLLKYGYIDQQTETGLITKAESYRSADNMPFGMKYFKPKAAPGSDYSLADHLNAHPYVNFALQEASKVTGISVDKLLQGGYTINTCFNTKDQKALNDAIQQAPALEHPDVDAAGVSLGPDGCVEAMVGNRDYSKLQINIATGKLGGGSGRTTGSSNKGFLVAANLNAGQHITDPTTLPKSVVVPNVSGQPSWVVNRKDECIDFGEKAPCSKKPDGTPITMADALAVSSNTWAAESVMEHGFQPTIDIMNGFGMNVPKPYTPSFILGIDGDPLHEAAGYEGLILGQGTARFTNGNPYYAVNSVIDPHGKIIYQRPAPTLHQVVSQANALQTTKALEEVINLPYSTAYGAIKSPGGPNSVAGKTGTAGIGNSTDNSDVWFSGAVRDRDDRLSRATSIWLGNDAGKVALGNGISSKTTAKIFGNYILNRPHTTGPADIAAPR